MRAAGRFEFVFVILLTETVSLSPGLSQIASGWNPGNAIDKAEDLFGLTTDFGDYCIKEQLVHDVLTTLQPYLYCTLP